MEGVFRELVRANTNTHALFCVGVPGSSEPLLPPHFCSDVAYYSLALALLAVGPSTAALLCS